MAPARTAGGVALAAAQPAEVERWLAGLGVGVVERVERDGIVAWDVVLDGRRRFDLRTTVIRDPALGLICWGQLAPPIGDGLRRAYRTLLRWNDEFPFAKFSLTEDGRPIIAAEIPERLLSEDELGLGLARLAGIADRLLPETAGWLWIGGRPPAGYAGRVGRNPGLLARFAGRLTELLGP